MKKNLNTILNDLKRGTDYFESDTVSKKNERVKKAKSKEFVLRLC